MIRRAGRHCPFSPFGPPIGEPQGGHARSGLSLGQGSAMDGCHEREGTSGGTALTVSVGHIPAEIAVHAAGTSRPSKPRLRIACCKEPLRPRLVCGFDLIGFREPSALASCWSWVNGDQSDGGMRPRPRFPPGTSPAWSSSERR